MNHLNSVLIEGVVNTKPEWDESYGDYHTFILRSKREPNIEDIPVVSNKWTKNLTVGSGCRVVGKLIIIYDEGTLLGKSYMAVMPETVEIKSRIQ